MDDPADPAPLSELTCEWPAATLVRDDAAVAPVAAAIFGDTRADAPMRLHLRGTNFQLKVWEALLRVPEGALISYGDLARRLDMPTAARAVASAVGANPIGYLIPCHRVLRSSGALGGYRWGLERKMVMLEVEEFGPSLPGCP
jgi:AraC family transcriptional regulator of adaptative response/methylated-DNA-[protein]-cysteine methyltransferase